MKALNGQAGTTTLRVFLKFIIKTSIYDVRSSENNSTGYSGGISLKARPMSMPLLE